jgi:integrase
MAAENLSATPPLTPKLIEAARPTEKDYELPDTAAPGLRLRVTPKGSKVFRWYVTSIGRVITIGRWSKVPRPGFVTLGEARSWLERLKDAHKSAKLEAVEAELKALRPARQVAPPSGTVGPLTVKDVAADFMKHIERRRKRPEQVQRSLDCDILPAMGERPIASVTPKDCRLVVEAVVARGATTQAGIVLGVMKQLFNFAWNRDDISANPTAPLRDPEALGVVKNTCQRYLTAKEIEAFWKALDAYKGMTPTVRNGLKLLLLLGSRSGELLQAELEEVDFDAATWTVPIAHQKLTRKQEQTARPWVVPLPPTALAVFGELRDLAKTLRSSHVMASFHAGGDRLTEKALNHAMRRLPVTFAGERPTPHDLRRTMRTHLGDALGVQFHIAERCLNHSLGKIATTYDVGDYIAERRAALEKWDAYVQRLISPAAAKVAFLPAAKGA